MNLEILGDKPNSTSKLESIKENTYEVLSFGIALAVLPVDMVKVLSGVGWDFLKGVKENKIPYLDGNESGYQSRRELAKEVATYGAYIGYCLLMIPRVFIESPYLAAKEAFKKKGANIQPSSTASIEGRKH